MPTVYRVEILNHIIDGYEDAQLKLIGAGKWLKSCSESEKNALDVLDELREGINVSRDVNIRAHRRLRETMSARHDAETERNVAREREQQAMRTLCDAVLLAAKGAT